jgi:ABC-type nitrate/sulfonate/bicarbonate transport system permease component
MVTGRAGVIDDESDRQPQSATPPIDPASYLPKRWGDKSTRFTLGIAGFVVFFLGWWVVSAAYHISVILPPPTTVLKNTWDILTLHTASWQYGPNIYSHVLTSLRQGVIGLALGAAGGIVLGLGFGRVKVIHGMLTPVVRALYPIPSIAWMPLAILWFGLGDEAIIVTVALAVFCPVFFSAQAGARQIDQIQLDAARCFGARGIRLFRKVVLPAAVPHLASGLRIGVGESWRTVVATEILVSQSGIGFVLNQSRFYFRAEDLITTMIIVAIIGYLTERVLVGTLEKRTIERWQVRSV